MFGLNCLPLMYISVPAAFSLSLMTRCAAMCAVASDAAAVGRAPAGMGSGRSGRPATRTFMSLAAG